MQRTQKNPGVASRVHPCLLCLPFTAHRSLFTVHRLPVSPRPAAGTESRTAAGSPGTTRTSGATATAAGTEASAHEGLGFGLLFRGQDVEYGQALAGSFIL